ncbi:MAG TPA: hypothetical protein PLP90_04995, partial [Methanoculleus sp.]|nr:hypothetical protein [Methanoculleus sp.]
MPHFTPHFTVEASSVPICLQPAAGHPGLDHPAAGEVVCGGTPDDIDPDPIPLSILEDAGVPDDLGRPLPLGLRLGLGGVP